MLNCHKLQGEFTKKIFVDTNDPSNPMVTLNCKGQIKEAIKITPNMVNFGRIVADQTVVERRLEISEGDAGPIKPELQPLGDDEVEAELREIEPGKRYELIVRAHPKPASNRLSGRITLNTGVEQESTVQINVYGTVASPIATRPPTVFVPPSAPANWEQAIDLVWADGDKSHRIVSATVNHPKLEIVVAGQDAPRADQPASNDSSEEVAPGKPAQGNGPDAKESATQPGTAAKSSENHRVLLRLKEPLGSGVLPANVVVTVTTDDPKAPSVTVPVRYQPPRRQPQPVRAAPPPRRATDPKTGAAQQGPAGAAKTSPVSTGAERKSPATPAPAEPGATDQGARTEPQSAAPPE